jgi:hypothetical protein
MTIPRWASFSVLKRMRLLCVTPSFMRTKQIFASRYKLVLPSEDELRDELDRERNQLAKQIEPEQSQ